jgi:catechol 2,3-dioxygenase-like lactoylglutathione lyase family enzyme
MTSPAFLHVNIRCADLEATRRFYERIIGLVVGTRPAFTSRGYWLYGAGMPVMHLVERRADAPRRDGSGAIDHLAFAGTDLDAMRRTLAEAGTPFRESVVPGEGTVQLFVSDPNGITIEIAFPPEPAARK